MKNCRAELLCPHILRLLAGSADADVAQVIAALSGWNYRYDLASNAPTVFETFMALWTRHVLAVHLPARLLDLTVAADRTGDQSAGGRGAGLFCYRHGDAGRSGSEAGGCRAAGTAGRRSVGLAVGARAPRALASSGVLAGAGRGVGYRAGAGGRRLAHRAQHRRRAAAARRELGRGVSDRGGLSAIPAAFLAVQNIGNSGVPGSPHYRDQFRPWIDGTYHVVHLTHDGVERDCASTTRLLPAG